MLKAITIVFLIEMLWQLMLSLRSRNFKGAKICSIMHKMVLKVNTYSICMKRSDISIMSNTNRLTVLLVQISRKPLFSEFCVYSLLKIILS